MCTSLISFHSRCSPLCSSWRPRRPSHQTLSWQPGILRRWSCGVEQSANRHAICTNTLYFQESAQDSFVFTVVFCTLSFINLIGVAYVVRRPCGDFTDMLRRHINCRIIIIRYVWAESCRIVSKSSISVVLVLYRPTKWFGFFCRADSTRFRRETED